MCTRTYSQLAVMYAAVGLLYAFLLDFTLPCALPWTLLCCKLFLFPNIAGGDNGVGIEQNGFSALVCAASSNGAVQIHRRPSRHAAAAHRRRRLIRLLAILGKDDTLQ